MKAAIVTIGDEILIGQILDTNSQFIAKALNSIGVKVERMLSITDNRDEIIQALDSLLDKNEIVILTGGLGPTKDDITKHTLASYFSSELYYNEKVGEHVRQLLAKRSIPFIDLNRNQAMVPQKCEVLFNAHGTAPGMLFEKDGHIVISLPGVPFEMKHLMEDEVLARIRQRFNCRSIVHRTLITSSIAESLLAQKISQWEDALPSTLHLAYLPAPNIVRLRLSAYDVEKEMATRMITEQFDKLRQIIPENIVGYEGTMPETLLHEYLLSHHETLSVAESCTGGYLASLFTSQSGASGYFLAGVVSYSNEAKAEILGVSREDLMRYGAVSEQVAVQMAQGVRKVSGATYAISTTGIAGPTGGSLEKPVGTVYIGISTPQKSFAIKKDCGTDRSQVISRASAYAVKLLLDTIK
ncbi:MAG: competence/damage-inducible protein A [Alistipes sp.]|nr:competence/damage-inducible protein A [Candidatus Alistipes equi]